ncbi:MAG: DUF1707 domain-containing protein [Jiangellaceae bacterium]|nr:DUF1707 domain-containing protein [Jiangellaceae bacterium]
MTQLRIGDAEREHAASALGEHYATGRLSKEEYDQRVEKVWAARFQADLEPLFADLPSPWRPARVSAPARPQVTPPVWRPAPRFGPLAPLLLVGLVAAVVVTGMPWLLFGLFWLAALSGCGRRDARRMPAYRQPTVGMPAPRT